MRALSLLGLGPSTLHTHARRTPVSASRSVDSAELRAAEAAARLRDYGATSSKPNTALPSALDAFTEVCVNRQGKSKSGRWWCCCRCRLLCVCGGGGSGVSLGECCLSLWPGPPQHPASSSSSSSSITVAPACLPHSLLLPAVWLSVQVAGRPAFLDPESTRPLATSRTHGLAGGAGGAAAAAAGQQGKGKKGRLPPAEGEFDISRLAPPVKGQQQ